MRTLIAIPRCQGLFGRKGGKWRILENNVRDFNPITGVCRLCTCEKYRIVLEPSLATLNRRTELFAPCRHKAAYLFEDPDPPDWTFIFLVVNCDIFFLCGTVIIFSCNLCTLYVVIWRLAYAMKHCVMTSWSSIKLNSVITFPASSLLSMLYLCRSQPSSALSVINSQ